MGHTKVKVEIYGNQYHILTDEDPDRVRELAGRVNSRMREIASMNPGMSATKVAILAALNFVGQTADVEDFCNLFARKSSSLIRSISEELND